ncbi:MAG: redoxin domain-containing protein [Candidatus Omnitrophica bacterium]|nr:redoxin domain-containing protein [Candidatus Omnitrophota bacterium]
MRKLIIFLLLVLAFTSCTKADTKTDVKNEPAQTRNFSLEDINGKAVNLSDYRGKVVILNFWATWCPPCRTEIPDFVKFYKNHKDKGVEIIGIALNSTEEEVKKMIEDYGINYTICMSDGKVEGPYGIRFIPATFIIDRDGISHPITPGSLSESELIKSVEPFL